MQDLVNSRSQAMRLFHGRKPGVPPGRTAGPLNEGLRPEEDAAHRLGGLHPYEWWYFDATFDNGYSAVLLMWPLDYTRLFSRRCTVMLSMYAPDGDNVVHYVYPERSALTVSYERCDVRIGDSYIRGAHPTYEVHSEVEGSGLDLVFEAGTPGWKPGTGVNTVPFPLHNTMGWLVPLPRARVTGTLDFRGTEIPVKGHGYHDHNWGEAPIVLLVDNWHWGNIAAGDVGIIWADITMCKRLRYDRTFMFLLTLGDRLVYESPELEISYGEWVADAAYLHRYPGEIVVRFGRRREGASGEFTMRVEKVVETRDLLEMAHVPGPLEPLIHRIVATPYYFRWLSRVSGVVEIEGKKYDLEGETIHEQMIFRGHYLRGGS